MCFASIHNENGQEGKIYVPCCIQHSTQLHVMTLHGYQQNAVTEKSMMQCNVTILVSGLHFTDTKATIIK